MISYEFEFDHFRIKSLKIIHPVPLRSLFWSLERLNSLELVDRSIPFYPNNSIIKLKFSVLNKIDSNAELEIHNSIAQLKKLKILHIEGYTRIKLPDNLKFLSNINKLIIDAPKRNEIPFRLLDLKVYPNVIINSHSKNINFNTIILDEKVKGPQMLLTYNSDAKLPDLLIYDSIKNFYLSTRSFSSNTIKIKGKVKKLLITPLRSINTDYFHKGDLWRLSEIGNFIFVYESGSNIPEIDSDCSNLTHFRLENPNTTKLSEWIFQSPNINKLILTSESLPFTIEKTFNEELRGLFQIKVNIHFNIPEIETSLAKLTHFRINLPKLAKLPLFISNLSQFKQLIIISETLNESIAPFDIPVNKYCLIFKVSNFCEFPRFLLQMKHLTHVWIKISNLKTLPDDFELYFVDTKKIKFYTESRIEESIMEYLEIPNPDYYVIKVHRNCKVPDFDEKILYRE